MTRSRRKSSSPDIGWSDLDWAPRRRGQHENCGRSERTVPRSSVVPRRSRLPNHQRRASRGWSYLLVFLLHFAVLVVCTQHHHAVYTIVYASRLRKSGARTRIAKPAFRILREGILPMYTMYATRRTEGWHLKAKLFVDHVRVFLVLLCRYPHLGKSVQTGKNRTSYPCRVLALRGSVDLDFDIFQGELLDLI